MNHSRLNDIEFQVCRSAWAAVERCYELIAFPSYDSAMDVCSAILSYHRAVLTQITGACRENHNRDDDHGIFVASPPRPPGRRSHRRSLTASRSRPPRPPHWPPRQPQ